MRVRGEHRQARLNEQLVVAQCRGHDALEEIARRDDALAAGAARHHVAVERDHRQAPFGGWIGVGKAAAERAAVADWIMRDMAHHVGQQFAERPLADRTMKRRMAHAGTDRKLAVGHRDTIERRDAVDVDEVGGLGEPERHGRNQALAAGKNAAVFRRDLGEQRDCLVNRLRCVIPERRRLHRLVSTSGLAYLF